MISFKSFLFENKTIINNNSFLKNVSTLTIGTLLSQAILIASSVILTRLFSAADYGVLAVFTSVSTIAAIITTGRYELAVVLPQKDKDAVSVVALVFVIGSLISMMYLLFVAVLKQVNNIVVISGSSFLKLNIIYGIPVFTFFAAIQSALLYWNQRKKKYKRITISNISQSLGSTTANIFFGFFGFTKFGLIFGVLIGQIFAIVPIFMSLFNSGNFRFVGFPEIKLKAKQYNFFPKYMIVSDFAMTTSQQIIPIVFSVLFSATTVGFFSLANRILRIPSILLSSSIGNVFRNEAVDVIRVSGNCSLLYRSTLKKLLILSAPIFILLTIVSPWLFKIVFGQDWIQAGYYAQIICIMLVFNFVATPLNSLFYIVKKQNIYMWLQILSMVFGIGSILLGYMLFKEPYYSILFYALSDAAFSLLSISLSYNISKQSYEL